MKVLETNNTLVIGTAHLGIDSNILDVLKTVSDYYNANVTHLGPLATGDEIRMWRSRVNKVRTWQREREQLEARIESGKLSDAQEAVAEKKLEDLCELETSVTKEIHAIEGAQDNRIGMLHDSFNMPVDFVSNEELHIPSEMLTEMKELGLYNYERKSITKYLNLTAVPANGDKTSAKPITNRTIDTLMQIEGSHIIPHATPQTHPVERPGLNQAYNYITTGCLFAPRAPKRISEAYLANGLPGGVLVSTTPGSSEFHAQRIEILHCYHPETKSLKPCVIHDGHAFFDDLIIELDSEDKLTHITDSHVPYEHKGVVGAMRALNKLHEPSIVVDGGDSLDLAPVSHHLKGRLGEKEGLRIRNDLIKGQQYLHAIANKEEFPSIEKRIMVDSNHGEWLTKYVDERPELKGILDWPSIQRDYFPDWDIMWRHGGEDRSFVFGDLYIRHGDKENTAKARRTFRNYLGGHWHGYYEFCRIVYAGAACMLGPKYLQNGVNNWQNSITAATKFGTQTVKTTRIVLHNEKKKTSRFVYAGKIYEVPFYEAA